MDRLVSNVLRSAIDLTILFAAFWLAFLIRLDGNIPWYMVKQAVLTSPYIVAFQFALLVVTGVTRFSWRYVSLPEVRRIFVTLAAAGVVLLAVRFVAGMSIQHTAYAIYAAVPYGVVVIDFTLAFGGITGIRVVRRLLGERVVARASRVPAPSLATILVGAGKAGAEVAKEVSARSDLGIDAVGFLDDDPTKRGSMIHGVAVLGPTGDLVEVCKRTGATQALLCYETISGAEIRRIRALADAAGIATKIIPSLSEIVSGHVNLSRIREVTIEDLLGRDPVVLDMAAIGDIVRGRTVLVSGAGGSIGSELCRQICRFAPAHIVLLEQAENNLFNVHRDLLGSFPDLTIVPCIGDVCDVDRVEAVFAQHRPDVVFHAAAHKHVPMMEWNPGEAIKNNVFGTKTLADAAAAHGVERFVMISTDKAVNPTSVMGVSKRVAEIYVQALSRRSSTRFVTVRFGNVLGSVGSVIPIFKEQIAKGGPVTVTHPEMKRYFMTIPEACQLVLQAGSMGEGGEIYILDMGEPVKIVDLARDLIRLSGLRPDGDIEVRFSGVRPGEKLFEELSVEDEAADKTRHAKVFVGRIKPHDYADVVRGLERLRAVTDCGEVDLVKSALGEIVPEYTFELRPATKSEVRPVREEAPVVARVASHAAT